MKNTKRTDKEFVEAIKNSTNIYQALKLLELNARGAAYKQFKKRCQELNVDTSHFSTDKDIRKSVSDESIIAYCESNISRQAVLKSFGLNPNTNTNVNWLIRKIEKLNINTDHWLGQAHLRGKTHSWLSKTPIENLLVYGTTPGPSFRKRLVKEGFLEKKCYDSRCGITDWYGSPISLQLEHINGDHLDNRIENLIFLCPNCHSQTDTFCRKKSAFQAEKISSKNTNQKIVTLQKPHKQVREPKLCADCSVQISAKSKRCGACFHKQAFPHAFKIEWPTNDDLLEMLKTSNFSAVARKLGVSDNAIRKRLKQCGLRGT